MKILKILLGALLGLYAIWQFATLALMTLHAFTSETPLHPLFYSKLTGVAVGGIIGAGLAYLLLRGGLRRSGTVVARKQKDLARPDSSPEAK
jgi:drug/metabolite transporter (DMT)-like permease